MHSTTKNNLERCMRTSINKAWQMYIKNKPSQPQNVNKEILFFTKPTVKEFIFFVANYIKDRENENKVYSVVYGTA